MTLDQHRAAGSIVSRWTVTFRNHAGVRVPFFGTAVKFSRFHRYEATQLIKDLYRDGGEYELIEAIGIDAVRSIKVEKLDYWRSHHALEVQG